MITKTKQAPVSKRAKQHQPGPLRVSEYGHSEMFLLASIESEDPDVAALLSEVGFVVFNPRDHEDVRMKVLSFLDYINERGINLLV